MKFGNLHIGRPPSMPDYGDFKDIEEAYDAALRSGTKRLILGVLAGRSGTRWLCDIFSAHDNATGVTERYPNPESFWRYIKYNKLPIDTRGVIVLIKKGILEDWRHADIALVFSPYFSHGLLELWEELKPHQIIFGIWQPRPTVQSMYNKGLFKERYFRDRNDLALGYQPELSENWSHFFGRIVPNGEEYDAWQKLTRIGKISWWLNKLLVDIHGQLRQLPKEKVFIFDLTKADQNYEYYKELANYFKLSPPLSEEKFLSLKGNTVKKTDNISHVWSETEEREFAHHLQEWEKIFASLS